ncbi:hypothetical protein SDC9_128257 [bioreactor metagenome]|uniref:Uncharacterized protein n=1 Tax=bioreactor metagenome TaxID=1076179 RepID=A0A645CWG9_9ZZZZ
MHEYHEEREAEEAEYDRGHSGQRADRYPHKADDPGTFGVFRKVKPRHDPHRKRHPHRYQHELHGAHQRRQYPSGEHAVLRRLRKELPGKRRRAVLYQEGGDRADHRYEQQREEAEDERHQPVVYLAYKSTVHLFVPLFSI